jgi:transcriptional antiterminator
MTKRESAQQSRQHSLAEGTISLNQLKDQLAVSRNQVSDSLDQCVFICPCDSPLRLRCHCSQSTRLYAARCIPPTL